IGPRRWIACLMLVWGCLSTAMLLVETARGFYLLRFLLGVAEAGFFEPLSQVLKRELLYVPFFGWALALLKPIAIDRSQPKLALKQLAKQGDECLKKGVWVLIFPEGTRIPVGQMGKFSRGGTALAVNAGLPVLPIAHNAGQYWPKAGWAKYPGTIQVVIGPAMHAEGEGPRAIAELNQRAEAWVSETMAEISP
ncbi:1-acyl-sn-glycerol-3-phosphate acyltransferase, partial [Escherichia coli]|uniref:lysophospholipid acyltransferase family protein n=1 Tax=Escherichia coli TaxID=562 RepID=UPI001C5313B5